MLEDGKSYWLDYDATRRGAVLVPRHEKKNADTHASGATEPILHGHETILLVEDEPAILRLTRIMLGRLGYKVLVASTPGEAIRLVREHDGDIHLLMTDVVMPEMNGRELAMKIVKIYPNLKRLYTSGYTVDVIAHHGALDESTHFIQKPFTLQALALKVREAIDTETPA